MKLIAETNGIRRLIRHRRGLAAMVAKNFEHRAKSCLTCETPGACCLDAHFVNVRITRIEAAAIRGALDGLDPETHNRDETRLQRSITRFGLAETGNDAAKTYACPLFEKRAGCLIHDTAKPAPCIMHACYERSSDLPPGELLDDEELWTADLNRRVYGESAELRPLPVAVARDSDV